MFRKKRAEKNSDSATAMVETVQQAVEPGIDPAIIAVITAAIAASLGTSSNGIVIKSLRRSGSVLPAWGSMGRIEQIANRF